MNASNTNGDGMETDQNANTSLFSRFQQRIGCANNCNTNGITCSPSGRPTLRGFLCMPCLWIWLIVLAIFTFGGCASSPGPDAARTSGPNDALPIVTQIDGASAHWIRNDRIIWKAPAGAYRYELRFDQQAGIALSESGIEGGQAITLQPDARLDFSTADRYRHIAAWPVFSLEASPELVARAIRGQVVAVALNREGQAVAATRVQLPGVIDQYFSYHGQLGPVYESGETLALTIWAPTAQSLTLRLYDAGKNPIGEVLPVESNPADGVYRFEGLISDWDRMFYRLNISVYHYQVNEVVSYEVTDPYSVSLSTDSQFSQFVNLPGDPTLKPSGWSQLRKQLPNPVDITLYEAHVRDFSAWDASVSPEHRGTYKAFTYNAVRNPISHGMKHLLRLSEAGLSHLHLLPVNDITTVIEDHTRRVDIDDPFWRICDVLDPSVVEQHGLAEDCEIWANTPIKDVFTAWAEENPATERIQRPYNSVRGNRGLAPYDGFNWGYDPYHFNVPEGSYSTDANGPQRILEFREMVMALHEIGLKVVVDVVYNHTSSVGMGDRSVLDKVVPGYYQRFNPETGAVETSTCCPNTASEHFMMEKLMVDSILLWAEMYKIDSFRFDLMGHHSLSNMKAVQDALATLTLDEHGVDGANIYIYGEGWNFGEVANNRIFDQATQFMTAGTGLGNFNDRLRDGIRGRNFTDVGRAQGFVSGQLLFPNEADTDTPRARRERLLYQADQIRVGLAGNLRTYPYRDRTGVLGDGGRDGIGYTLMPRENVNYIDKHDNETLWDNTQTKLPLGMSTDDRVRIHILSNAFINYGQGVPFYQMGTDILRSKSLDRNSYDSGDWFNRVDFTLETHNWGTGLPPSWDNSSRWDEMRPLHTNPNIVVTKEHMELAHTLFMEQLRIRYSTPLFRLRTAEDVHRRVRFHNTGPDQHAGLIVMSIADGDCAGRNLDENFDGVLVIFNADIQERTFTLDLPGIDGMELHPILQGSADSLIRRARAEGKTFVVPALSAAVFVKRTQLPMQEFPCNVF
jgi:pullulanase